MSKIKILLAADGKYSQHLAVTIVSVLVNTKHPENIEFTIIDGGFGSSEKEKVTSLVNEYKASIRFNKVTIENPEKFKVSGHVSIATYYRLFLPQLFTAADERVIYIDCDLVVNHDIAELYNLPMDGCIIAAVAEPGSKRGVEMGITQNPYFNAGVLLIDIRRWIDEEVSSRAISFIQNFPEMIVFWDQDAMNEITKGRVKIMDQWWNYQRPHVLQNKDWKHNRCKKYIPGIVHYSNNTKPWHYVSRNPYDYLYYVYLAKTPWKGFVPSDKNYITMLKKNVKLAMRYFGFINW